MAGPRMIGIRDVVNPVDGLQDTVSKVGDIYRNYEQDRRASQLHAEQMAEFERKENARQYLNNYTPELGGADFKGIDAETKKAMILEEGQILKNLAETDATPDEYRRVTGEIARRRAQLVTREAVTADVYNDLIRNGVDPETAKHFAAIEGSKHESLESRFASAAEAGASEEERLLKRGELAAKWFDARTPPRSSSSSTRTGGGGVSAEGGTKVFSTAEEAEKYLESKIGYGWLDGDHKRAIDNINAAIAQVNDDRRKKNEKPISIANISNLIQYSVTTDETDNDVVYGSTAEWKNAIEGYLSSLGNSGGAGSSSGRVVPTAYEEAAVIAALQGAKGDAPTRAEIVRKRVRGVYGDLYKTLKTAEATEDGGIRVLGGTGNSGQSKGSGNNQNTGTTGETGTSNTGSTSTGTAGGVDEAARESRLLAPTEPLEPPVILPLELMERREAVQSRIAAITNKPEGSRTYEESLTLNNLNTQLRGIEKEVADIRSSQSGSGGSRLPAPTEPPVILPPELIARREDTQARINAITNKSGARNHQDAFVLRRLESRLEDIEEQENKLRREQSRPRVEAAYNAAVDAGVGTNVPEDLYSVFRSSTLRRYSTNQLQELEDTVADEYNNYRAVLEHAELTGDKRTALDARARMWKLRQVSGYIDRRLGRTRLPE